MAGPLSAIPASSLKPISGVDDADEKYRSALDKITSALEAREAGNTQQMLLAITQGLLTPGPTGHFGESLGHAAGNVSKMMQAQEASGLENAKMRLQLAQAEREQGNKNKAISLASSALGITPNQFVEGMQTGSLPPGSFSKIKPEVYFAIANADPKVGEYLKNIHAMDIETAKLALELRKQGVGDAELIAKFGPDIASMLPPIPFAQPKPSASTPSAAAPSDAPEQPAAGKKEEVPVTKVEVPENLSPSEQARFKIIVSELNATENKLNNTTDTNDRQKLKADVDALKRELSETTKTKQPAIVEKKKEEDFLEGLPLELKNKLREQFTKDAVAPFSEKRKNIYIFDPQTISAQDSNLREIYSTVAAHPDVVGLMVGQGFFNALGAAMQKGSQTPWGTWSLPVTEFVSKLKLPPEKQTIATRVGQLLAQQFFENGRTNKSLLGPQISNADVMLLKAPIAGPEDSAEAIKYWVKHQILGNKQKSDLYGALMDFDQSRGVKANPAEFFNPKKNPQYADIIKRYQSYTDQLVQEHSPAFMGRR